MLTDVAAGVIPSQGDPLFSCCYLSSGVERGTLESISLTFFPLEGHPQQYTQHFFPVCASLERDRSPVALSEVPHTGGSEGLRIEGVL